MENFILFYGILITILLSFILNIIPYIFNNFKSTIDQISPYECGFDPFQDVRERFDVRFYLVALIFIIFDLEIAMIFPWSISFISLYTIDSIFFMFSFIIMLFFTFIFEVLKGILN